MRRVVSVVAPFYNEEQNVPLPADEIDAIFRRLDGYERECFFVNGGSTDGTRDAIDAMALANPGVRDRE